MKALITADIHGLYSVWQKVTRLLNKDDILIIAGDFYDTKYGDRLNPDFQPEKIIAEFDNLINEKYFVYGNCDLPSSYPHQNRHLSFEMFGKSIFLTHGDELSSQPEIIAIEKKPDIYIYGHTHVFALRKYQEMLIINPGSLSKPKTANYTYATITLENKTLKTSIIDLHKDEELMVNV